MFIFLEHVITPRIFDIFMENPYFWAPKAFNLNKTTQQAEIAEVMTKFKSMYMYGEKPSLTNRKNWIQFQTDSVFSFGTDRVVRYFANKSSSLPIYYYTFSMDGSRNMVKHTVQSPIEGACHADVSQFS